MASAEPLLTLLARMFRKWNLEVVLIGNAAASIQGAPLTTLDFDFMLRNVPQNRVKLKSIKKS
jgi:hypothetical protein